MDLQPSWGKPFRGSLGEDDKVCSPDPKGPVKGAGGHDEVLSTVMTEATNILNSRPFT